MIRCAEAVLPGHPDKLCDQMADAVIAEALAADPMAVAQVEAGIWGSKVWLSGHALSRRPLARPPAEVVTGVARELGLALEVTDTISVSLGDPREARANLDDQSIVIGYAGYDAATRFLPPEQFLVHWLGEALWQGCRSRSIPGGPDGKLLLIMREEGTLWIVEKIVVTLQHAAGVEVADLTYAVEAVLADTYRTLRRADRRWAARWEEVDLLVNPNGPHLLGGSDGDNGQTGRKLVMDFYGPRIPLGGGALSGKHPGQIDRMGSYAARAAAVAAVRGGAQQCLLQLVYAPNRDAPLEIVWDLDGRGPRRPDESFCFSAMLERVRLSTITAGIGMGTHFWDPSLLWNTGEE